MKKLYAILLSLFFVASYAQAESMMPQMEPTKANTEQEDTGFFSFGLGGEVIPADRLAYYTTVLALSYGGVISEQSSFNAGVKITPEKLESSFLALRYAYSFIKGRKWIPGIDVSLLLGFSYDNLNQYRLSGGFELGPYLKTFISTSHALLLRAGVTYDTSTANDFDLTDSRAYLNLAVQWYF